MNECRFATELVKLGELLRGSQMGTGLLQKRDGESSWSEPVLGGSHQGSRIRALRPHSTAASNLSSPEWLGWKGP